jgi:hypothetical protein
MAGPTARAWFEELRLGPVLASSLRDRGLDEAQAWAAAERLRLLLAIARPSNIGGRTVADRANRLADAWLTSADTRGFLRANVWEGVEWISREAWRELLDWALLLDLIDGGEEDVDVAARVTERLLESGEVAGYRVDRLREGLRPATRRVAARPATVAPGGRKRRR